MSGQHGQQHGQRRPHPGKLAVDARSLELPTKAGDRAGHAVVQLAADRRQARHRVAWYGGKGGGGGGGGGAEGVA